MRRSHSWGRSLSRTYNIKRSSWSHFPQPVLTATGAMAGLNWGEPLSRCFRTALAALPPPARLLGAAKGAFVLLQLFRQRSASIFFP